MNQQYKKLQKWTGYNWYCVRWLLDNMLVKYGENYTLGEFLANQSKNYMLQSILGAILSAPRGLNTKVIPT